MIKVLKKVKKLRYIYNKIRIAPFLSFIFP